MSVRCLVADDHPALVAAVTDFLADLGYEVIGPVADGASALALAHAERPELALVDYRMPRLAGAELIAGLKAASPETRVAVYTAEADERVVNDALEAGATALILKESPLADVGRALESTLAGRAYLDPSLARAALGVPRGRRGELTARELAVLRLLAEGLSHEEIGNRLSIGSETVRTHSRKAADRLGASTRTQAVATALRLGLID